VPDPMAATRSATDVIDASSVRMIPYGRSWTGVTATHPHEITFR
jgi:hypothetical protein